MKQIAYDVKTGDRPVVFFDGTCGLCHGFVRWVVARDRAAQVLFAPLGGQAAAYARSVCADWPEDLDTIIVWLPRTSERPRLRWYSDGVLGLASWLPRPWSWLRFLVWVPRPLRDVGYRVVERVRYRVFGRREVCDLSVATKVASRLLV